MLLIGLAVPRNTRRLEPHGARDLAADPRRCMWAISRVKRKAPY
jgi:hypothetical protein